MLSKLTRAGMALVLVTTALVLAPAAPASAASAYLAPNDFCVGQCHDILPDRGERQRHPG